MCNNNEKVVTETRLETQVRELKRDVEILQVDNRELKATVDHLEKLVKNIIKGGK